MKYKILTHYFLLKSDAGLQYCCKLVGRGAQPPIHTPTTTHTLKLMQKVFKNKPLFPHFWTVADGLTHGPTDGWTDGQSLL